MTVSPSKSTSGFTLLEATIVIFVLGLIVGGIFATRDLVQQAGVRKQISQIQQIESGVNSFRTKYICMPGDCADPTVINGYTYTGNGNGFLEATWDGDENKGFWTHLKASGFLQETPEASTPTTKITPRVATNKAGVINAYGSLTYGQNVLEFDTNTVNGAFKVAEVIGIDKKLDDGQANSGSIRSTGFGSGATTVYNTNPVFPLSIDNNSGSTQCVSAGSYSANATIGECNMVYVMGLN